MKKLFETLLTGIFSLVFSASLFSNTFTNNAAEMSNSDYIQNNENNENSNSILNPVDRKNTNFIATIGSQGNSDLIYEIIAPGNQMDVVLVNTKNENISQASSISLEEEIISSFNVFPNPASEKLFVRFNGWEGIKEIKLIDITGRSVLVFKSDEVLNEIDISSFPKGIYLIAAKNEFHYEVKKIKIH